jgi:hypothetical protein
MQILGERARHVSDDGAETEQLIIKESAGFI